ncbi:MAG: ACT domain-containing protein [Planctomycetota bacterium]
MRRSLIITLLGPDRTGLVDAVAARIAAVGANWVESKLTRLAGHFAGVVRVDADPDAVDPLRRSLDGLTDEGLTVHIALADEPDPATPADPATALRVVFVGHDRPGIVRDIAHALADLGVNVDDLATSVTSAPMTGEPMFTAAVLARRPPGIDPAALIDRLEALAADCDLDLAVDPPDLGPAADPDARLSHGAHP